MGKRKSSPAAPPAAAAAGGFVPGAAGAVVALAAAAACSGPGPTLLWEADGLIRTNVWAGGGPGLLFWPRGLKPHLEPLGVPCCNLAMLGYCIFVAQKVRAAMPGAGRLESGVATLLTAFGGGTIVPLLLGQPVVWLRLSDLFLYHVILALVLVDTASRPLGAVALGVHVLFQCFRAAVVFAMMAMAQGAELPGGVGTLSLLVCGTLGGCGGVFMPFSKGLEPLRGGAPPLMATAFTATATYLGAAAALRTAAGSDVVASLGGDESCLAEPKLTQLAQFLTVVYFLASSLL